MQKILFLLFSVLCVYTIKGPKRSVMIVFINRLGKSVLVNIFFSEKKFNIMS